MTMGEKEKKINARDIFSLFSPLFGIRKFVKGNFAFLCLMNGDERKSFPGRRDTVFSTFGSPRKGFSVLHIRNSE